MMHDRKCTLGSRVDDRKVDDRKVDDRKYTVRSGIDDRKVNDRRNVGAVIDTKISG